MRCMQERIQALAYGLVLFGCLTAVITAFEPEPTGAWHLVAAYLVCGLIPYIVYGSLTTLLDGCTLLLAGVAVLTTDLIARLVFAVTAAAQPDLLAPVWLCTLLVLAVLPLGVLGGKLAGRLPVCRASARG
jgi:uncharacterized membrane protein